MFAFLPEEIPLLEIEVTRLNEYVRDGDDLKVVNTSVYQAIPQTVLSYFCYKYGFYCLPTVELCEWLKEKINGRSAITIGSGHGAIGKYLGIPATDSKLQESALGTSIYSSLKQPVVKYPKHIVKMHALEAIDHYKPEVVIGAWVTQLYLEDEHWRGGNLYGIDEDEILDNVNVQMYIVIGHKGIHSAKRIRERKHQEITFPWLFSRSMKNLDQVVYVWGE